MTQAKVHGALKLEADADQNNHTNVPCQRSCKLLETPQKRELEVPDDWSTPEEQILSHL